MIRNLFSSPTVTFCEEITNNFVSRPNYAISNLVYIIIGLILLSKIKQHKIYLPFAILTLVVGSFSLIYDIKPLYLTQLFDLLAMMIIASLMISLNLSKLYKLKIKTSAFVCSIMVTLGMTLVLLFQNYTGNYVFGSLVLLIIATEILIYKRKLRNYYKYWLSAMIIFLVAFAFWLPDGTKTFCNPIPLLNGRAIFHYLTAISLYLLAMFYSKNELK